MMFIPYRLRQDVRPGLSSLGAGYNKSPRVPDLSFPSSYRDSTSLSERYPQNSIVGDNKDTKESTVPIIIIIVIINDLKWNVDIIYNYPPKRRWSEQWGSSCFIYR